MRKGIDGATANSEPANELPEFVLRAGAHFFCNQATNFDFTRRKICLLV